MGVKQMKFLAVLAGALALGPAAQAATYDAFDSFNGTQGAGGFSYVKLPVSAGAPAAPLTAPSGSCIVTAAFCLQDGGALPGVYKSLTGGAEGTYTIPNDRLLVHPGNPNPLLVVFKAPTAGDYDFTLALNVLDRSPTGVAVAGLKVLGGTVSSLPLTFLNAASPTFSTSGTITLAKDDLFGVIINPAGSYANDSTGLDFTLTTAGVPEPASWALMIGGFGAAGAMLRRRRALAA